MKERFRPSKNSAISYLDVDVSGKPITVVGTEPIVEAFDELCIQQAINSRTAPGVKDFILNPDAHAGYGAPVGSVMVTEDVVYPGPVGVDIKCSMSLLQLDLPSEAVKDKKTRRAIINAIEERVPTGPGNRQAVKGPKPSQMNKLDLISAVCYGAHPEVLDMFDIPNHWRNFCEDSSHGNPEELNERFYFLVRSLLENNATKVNNKLSQFGSIGGGNHFIEFAKVLSNGAPEFDAFNLQADKMAFLSHFGSRGFGNLLAVNQFKILEKQFEKWHIPFPGNDKELVYAPLDSEFGKNYLNDMYLGANFATVNHLLVNKLLLDAVQEVIPGTNGDLIYYISHNIAREEVINGRKSWVFRKGATRAYPAKHFSLKETPFYETGHPILLPGNAKEGSYVMVGLPGSEVSAHSVNHGAGRALGRREAKRRLNQQDVNKEMDEADILTNCRNYPIDEAAGAYKNFEEVIKSVEIAGLAKKVARLQPMAVIKDADDELKGAA